VERADEVGLEESFDIVILLLELLSHYKYRDFYIAGESYAGINSSRQLNLLYAWVVSALHFS
jgi:carboxypeptidase C (cathepsin A)